MGGGGSPWGQAARGHPNSLRNVQGPTSSATCVASSLPSLVAATLADRAGQDQEEEGQSRDRQKVPTTAACAAAAADPAAAASLPPWAWPPTSSPTLHGIFGSLDTRSGPGPPAIPPTEQGHEKVRLGQGMQGGGGDMTLSNLGQGKLARNLKEGRGLNASKPNVSAPSSLRDCLPSALVRTLCPFPRFLHLKITPGLCSRYFTLSPAVPN